MSTVGEIYAMVPISGGVLVAHTCGICNQGFPDRSQAILLKCSHAFHVECIGGHFANQFSRGARLEAHKIYRCPRCFLADNVPFYRSYTSVDDLPHIPVRVVGSTFAALHCGFCRHPFVVDQEYHMLRCFHWVHVACVRGCHFADPTHICLLCRFEG